MIIFELMEMLLKLRKKPSPGTGSIFGKGAHLDAHKYKEFWYTDLFGCHYYSQFVNSGWLAAICPMMLYACLFFWLLLTGLLPT